MDITGLMVILMALTLFGLSQWLWLERYRQRGAAVARRERLAARRERRRHQAAMQAVTDALDARLEAVESALRQANSPFGSGSLSDIARRDPFEVLQERASRDIDRRIRRK